MLLASNATSTQRVHPGSAGIRDGGHDVHRQLSGGVWGSDVSSSNGTVALLAGLAERIPDPQGGVARKFRLNRGGRAYLRCASVCQEH
ncbi:hypothetical protein GCM10020220_072130 [Nonomuraea rubra]